MKIQKDELLKILNLIKPGLSKKSIVEQTTHFVFTGKEIATFNDQICIMYPYKGNLQFSVKGEEFHKILSGITENEVELSLEKETLGITTENTKAGMTTLVSNEDKIEHILETLKKKMKDWKLLPKEFIRGLFLCMFSAAKDMTMGILSCVAINKDNICSTDSLRASWYYLSEEMIPFLLPARDATELVKFPITKYCLSENWAHFKTEDGITFSGKLMKGEYKNIEEFFKVGGTEIVLPKETKNLIDSVLFLAEGEFMMDKIVYIRVKGKKLICKAKKEIGWIEKVIDIDKYDGDLKLMVNPIFLSQVLDKATTMIISEDRALFVNEDFNHVMALPTE